MGNSISEKTLALLQAFPWSEAIPQLAFHAERKMDRLRWRNSWNGSPPGGAEALDIVQEVILKVFAGERRWSPEKHPDLFLWLRDQIDSVISSLVLSGENRKFITPTPGAEDSTFERIDGDTPESILIKQQEEDESETILLELLELLQSDPDLQRLVTTIIESQDGVPKRSDLAASLGITPKELDAWRKRLFRRVEEYKKGKSARMLEMKGGPVHGYQ
jgi:DNA-directed RNA polymerase specialized sigma24 family protein